MVNTGFTRKKVESMTLGEKLKKIRSEYRISLNEVSKQTKIQIKYLEYLENGEYEKLPADVYVRGFVRSYALFLGTDEAALVKVYERERNIQKNIKKEHFQEHKESSFNFPRFIVTPKLFVIAGIVLFSLGGFVYLYREFQSFAAVPRLIVAEPSDGQTIDGNEVLVRGTTEKDANILINGQPVLVREDGDFYEQVRLQPGLNTFTVTAANKFKKEKTVTVSVQAKYPDASVVSPGDFGVPAAAKTKFEVSTQGKPLSLSVEIDGVKAYSGVMAPDAKQVFDVGRELKISSEDGGKTFVRLENVIEAKPISAVSGPVTDIVLTPENFGSHAE